MRPTFATPRLQQWATRGGRMCPGSFYFKRQPLFFFSFAFRSVVSTLCEKRIRTRISNTDLKVFKRLKFNEAELSAKI